MHRHQFSTIQATIRTGFDLEFSFTLYVAALLNYQTALLTPMRLFILQFISV